MHYNPTPETVHTYKVTTLVHLNVVYTVDSTIAMDEDDAMTLAEDWFRKHYPEAALVEAIGVEVD